MGQGERPAGQPFDELQLIATDSMFYLFSFLVISSNRSHPAPLYILLGLAQRWSGSMEAEVFNFKPQTWTMQVK